MTELAEPFAMTQPAISKHLKVLERAGLVSRRRDAQRRPCRLEADALRAATEWLDAYRRFWAERYERLDAPARRDPGRGPPRPEDPAMSQTATLDVEPVGDRPIRIVRSFRAPRQLVFDAHTEPELLARWLGPADLDADARAPSTCARAARSAT